MNNNELDKNEIKSTTKDASEPKKDVSGVSSEEIQAQDSGILAFCHKLDKIDPKTKVKVKILDFESFRQFLPFVDKYNNKFSIFKYETDFTVISTTNHISKDVEIKSFKESFTNYLKNQKIDPKITEILQKEVE